MSITLQELATHCHARLEGGNPDDLIDSAADITTAHAGQLTQLTNPKYSKYLEHSTASACIIGADFKIPSVPKQLALLICADPEISFIHALHLLHPAPTPALSIAPQAVVADNVSLGEAIHIGPYAIINDHSSIGSHSQIMAGAYIGQHCKIGQHCQIHPYAVIYDNVEIGDHVIIHSGAIIGADGFGYKFRNHQHITVPQVGNVRIDDHVEIGANTCIDRGALGSTVIGQGSKIDNLVQIGHNNQVGKHVIMCGQVGVSGSCTIHDYAIFAGSAGIADHLTIGQGAVIMARAGVANDVPAASHVFGSPAKDKRTAYKEHVALTKLPELLKKVKHLEDQLHDLLQHKN